MAANKYPEWTTHPLMKQALECLLASISIARRSLYTDESTDRAEFDMHLAAVDFRVANMSYRIDQLDRHLTIIRSW